MIYATELHSIELNFKFVLQAGRTGQFNNKTTLWGNLKFVSRL